MTEEARAKTEQLQSMVNSLKEISTIIVGLALTNTIIQFLLVGETVREITEIGLESAVIFALLIVTMIRFYHGNFRHLDVTYSSTSLVNSASGSIKQHPRGEKVSIDFFCVLLESLILCAMSFYQGKPLYFFYIFGALMIVDIIWFFVTYQFVLDKEMFKHQKVWMINNVIAIISLFLIYSFSTSIRQEILTYAPAIVLFINTIVDYKINWNFYFPIYVDVKKNEGEN